MRVFIVTGVYPPAIGGPAQYAKNLAEVWRREGHKVEVATFHLEHFLPTGIRHLLFFFKILFRVLLSDFVLALDTFSVGWPATCAARLFGKKIIIRTGGDFLWEDYVELTKEKVLLRNFYQTTKNKWNWRQRVIFNITKWTLHHANALVFSTKWQRDIWFHPYKLENVSMFIVENYYGGKEESCEPRDKVFIASTRPLAWKNLEILNDIEVKVDLERYRYEELMDKIVHGYGVLLVSLGDISPNLILDAIRHNKPFIVTEENGLMNRIEEIAVTIDPLDKKDIQEKINQLLDEKSYKTQVEKIRNFKFTHSWEQIGHEIIEIWKHL